MHQHDKAIAEIAEMIQQKYGLYYPPYRWSILRTAATRFMEQHKIEEWDAFLYLLRQYPQELKAFVDANMPHETKFFRILPQFTYLEQHILPRYKAEGKYLRIWSAATANGAEAYSLAISLCRASFTPREAAIVATDMKSQLLTQAKQGHYAPRYLENVPETLRKEFFTRQADGSFQVLPELSAYIHWQTNNLVQWPWPWPEHSFDIVFLEHILIYFSASTINKVLQETERILKPNGYLFLSYSERIPENRQRYWQTVIADNAIVHQLRATPAEDQLPKPAPKAQPRHHRRAPRYQGLQWQRQNNYPPRIASPKTRVAAANTMARKSHTPIAEAIAYYQEGKAALQQQQLEKALHAMDKALYINDQMVEAALIKAGILTQQGQRQEAQRTYRWVLEMLQKPEANILSLDGLNKETMLAICQHNLRG